MTSLTFIPAFMNLGTGEIIIIVFVILLLFGGKKIPELMKGLGKGVRSFKQGMNEITDEISRPVEEEDNKPAEKK
ncbi:MAG: twin-arginine translocase TatA/TatE family subunit [Bacteroidales bacterium]|nr:twin-arginine translocase TatA/TatE family subunit [Bacteroidales bacterium]MBD5376711.1 twin-arginine translocase TatA/TatE family subunit [Bacteroides sp.]